MKSPLDPESGTGGQPHPSLGLSFPTRAVKAGAGLVIHSAATYCEPTGHQALGWAGSSRK